MTCKKILIPLIIVLVAVILIFAIFLFQKRADSNKDIKTVDLLESILNDQSFMLSLYLTSSLSHNYTEKWKKEYSAINDLLARNDAAKVIYKKYFKLFPNGRQQGAFYTGEGQVVLCLLFSDDIYPQLSARQKKKVEKNPFSNNDPPIIEFDSSYIIAYDIDSGN